MVSFKFSLILNFWVQIHLPPGVGAFHQIGPKGIGPGHHQGTQIPRARARHDRHSTGRKADDLKDSVGNLCFFKDFPTKTSIF